MRCGFLALVTKAAARATRSADQKLCQISSKFKIGPTPRPAAATRRTTTATSKPNNFESIIKNNYFSQVAVGASILYSRICLPAFLCCLNLATTNIYTHTHTHSNRQKLKSKKQVEPFVIYKRLNHK